MADKSQIAQDILRYLVKHPGAQDTLEGIYEWWMLEEDIARRTTEVNEALAELVGEGLVIEGSGKGSQTHYRMNLSRYGQILARLSGNEDEANGDGTARRARLSEP